MSKNQFKRGELYSVINAMAATAIARRMQKNFRTAGLEITTEQWSILYHLWKDDGINQQQLCERTFRDKPSITRLIDNLVKMGLVTRKSNKNDKRVNFIFLTETAKELQQQTIEIANQTMDEALVGITKNEIETVKNVLQKVYDNLQGLQ
ncbi:MAG: MarR family transcriptional regulator [Nitrosarchaeum sp.]|nr:MarR family transcriptional regulator [Nitrosarchaeum sp.]